MKKSTKIIILTASAYLAFCLFVYWFNKKNVWRDQNPGSAEVLARILSPFNTLRLAKEEEKGMIY